MKDNKGLIFIALFILLITGLSFAFSYMIATSDMPDWLKFCLLK